jgi:flavin-dependent dehydrogenase
MNETPSSAHANTADRADVVVVGGRCAGAATAMLLARSGHDVLVVDRAEFPSDTLSTHAIARIGVVQLHRWGLLDSVLASGAPAVRDVVFHLPTEKLELVVKDRHGVDLLVAPRRHVLDSLLLDAAREAGARVRTGVTVTGVHRDDHGRVTGIHGRDDGGDVHVSARFVVGADGLKSRIARSVDAPFTDVRPSHGAAHYTYYEGDWSAMEYYVGPESFAGIFPTHDGEACIWVCAPAEVAQAIRRRHDAVDGAFEEMVRTTAPALFDRLDPANRRSGIRSAMQLPNHIRRPVGDGWALVGDAGYHRDPITGLGISDAFRDAELVAHAIDGALLDPGDEHVALASYHRERDRMLRETFEITCELSQLPELGRFTELQRQLSAAIEAQAAELAARPALASLAVV